MEWKHDKYEEMVSKDKGPAYKRKDKTENHQKPVLPSTVNSSDSAIIQQSIEPNNTHNGAIESSVNRGIEANGNRTPRLNPSAREFLPKSSNHLEKEEVIHNSIPANSSSNHSKRRTPYKKYEVNYSGNYPIVNFNYMGYQIPGGGMNINGEDYTLYTGSTATHGGPFPIYDPNLLYVTDAPDPIVTNGIWYNPELTSAPIYFPTAAQPTVPFTSSDDNQPTFNYQETT